MSLNGKFVPIVGGSLHGMTAERSLFDNGDIFLEDDRKEISDSTLYGIRQIDVGDTAFFVECVAPKAMSDSTILKIIDEKGMKRSTAARKHN